MSMSKYYIYKMNILDDPLYFGSYIGQHKIGKKEPMKDGYKGSGSEWKKYILSNHVPVEKEILCMCESVEEANEMERFYIEQYKNDGIYLWNKSKGGEGHECGRVYTDEELKEHNNQSCKQYYEAHKKHKKQYRDAHKEHIAEYGKQWRDAHKEYVKQYIEANKEKLVEYRKRYYEQYNEINKEKIAKHKKKYYEVHKEHKKQRMKRYNNQLCQYNDEILTLNALSKRFGRQGYEHPAEEAKKYLIEQEVA